MTYARQSKNKVTEKCDNLQEKKKNTTPGSDGISRDTSKLKSAVIVRLERYK